MTTVWNDAKLDHLVDLYREGLSYRAIAAEIPGISRNGIAGRVAKLVNAGILVRRTQIDRKPPPPMRKTPRFNPSFTEKAAPTPPEPELLEPMLVGGKPVTIRTCDDKTCRWPMSEASADMVMCGRPPKAGTPYCEAHVRKSYAPQQYSVARQRQAEKTAEAVG